MYSSQAKIVPDNPSSNQSLSWERTSSERCINGNEVIHKEAVMRWRIVFVLALVGVFGMLTHGALAGGWATVTLDTLPKAVRAGESVRLGFMIRQHGDKPISDIGGEPLTPFLIATHSESNEQLKVPGRQEGAQGHFVLDVSFPKTGAWTFKIIPAPFPDPTEIGTNGAVIALDVLPPVASEPAGDAARPALPPLAVPQTGSQTQTGGIEAPTGSRTGMWIAIGGVLALALGLTVFVQRGGLRRTAK